MGKPRIFMAPIHFGHIFGGFRVTSFSSCCIAVMIATGLCGCKSSQNSCQNAATAEANAVADSGLVHEKVGREELQYQPRLHSPEVREQRDILMWQATSNIRKDMLELAEEFPVLKKAYQWDSFLQEDEPGKEGRDLRWRQSSFMLTSVHRTPKQYDPTDLPPPERFEIWVYLCQRPNALRQPVLCEIYTDLDIVGQFHVGAVDPNLDRAIKDIFIRAFKPIEDLNQKAGKQSASK